MKIVYYYVLYLRGEYDRESIEIHLRPFKTKEAAEAYKEKYDKHFADRVYHSKIKRVDLAKSEKGLWL